MWLAFLDTPPVTTFEMEGSAVGKCVIFRKSCDLHFTTHYFHAGLACLEIPSSWPVQTWLLLPLVCHILTQFISVPYCTSAHRLGQSKHGFCFLLCVASLLDSFGCHCNSAHHLGQSKHGYCFLLCVVSPLHAFWCHIVTLHIILASPNIVAASSCDLYTCSIIWVSDCNSTCTRQGSPGISEITQGTFFLSCPGHPPPPLSWAKTR